MALGVGVIVPSAPAAAASSCVAGWSRVAVVAETDDEVPYLEKIFGCENLTTGVVALRNNSDMVWAFPGAREADVRLTDWSDKSTAYRRMIGDWEWVTPPIMAPGDEVQLVGATATRWVIDGWQSVMWAGMNELYSVVEKFSTNALKRANVAKSLTRAALWTCGAALVEYLNDFSSTPLAITGKQLLGAMGIASSVSDCAKAWKKAAAANRSWFPSWGDDLVAIGKSAQVAKKLSTYASRAARAAELFCGFIPRIC